LPPDFETSKKYINHGRAERWGATAGYGINSHPTPGSLFAMGWSRSLSKDLFTFFESAKKKNYLLRHLFYFIFYIIRIDRLQHDHISSPLRSPPVARPFIYLPRRARVFLVGC
jgi:hypothetical protein